MALSAAHSFGGARSIAADALCAPLPVLGTATRVAVRTTDAIAAARVAELLAGSMVVREMDAYLETADVAVTIASSISLMRDHRAGGLSRFVVQNNVLIGRVEFDSAARDAPSQRIALAHELAHAVELASLPRQSTSALGQRLLARTGQHDPWSSHMIIETAFPREVGARVGAEFKYGPAPEGTLETLAKRHRLTLNPCGPDEDGTSRYGQHSRRTRGSPR